MVEEIKSIRLENYQIPEQDIYYLQKLGFSGSRVEVYEKSDSHSTKKYISYVLEGDIEMKSQDLRNMLPEASLKKGGNPTAQYRTTIVAKPNLYTIAYFGFAMEPNLLAGLRAAVQNYNNLDIGVTFRIQSMNIRDWGRAASDKQVIRFIPAKMNGGIAGFPDRLSNPYGTISIDKDIGITYNSDVAEHVITHEMGHCIGLRHTDFFNRDLSNCPRFDINGNPVNPDEGQSDAGAIHIPGTPEMVATDRNSVMKACFGSEETGEFTADDITALRAIW